MAQQHECSKCVRMRCSFYAAKPQFDDKSCDHFKEKRPLYGMTTPSQTDGESIMDCYYRGPWYKKGRRKTFFERHAKLDNVLTIVSIVLLGSILRPMFLYIYISVFRLILTFF